MTRRALCPPSRVRWYPDSSLVKGTPCSISHSMARRPFSTTKRVAFSSFNQAPAIRVSRMCASIESWLSRTAAIPPCAHPEAESSRLRLLTSATRQCGASLRAADWPARPLPMIRTSNFCTAVLCKGSFLRNIACAKRLIPLQSVTNKDNSLYSAEKRLRYTVSHKHTNEHPQGRENHE